MQITREQSLEIAKANRKAYTHSYSDYIFGRRDTPPDEAFYGHKHGWYIVGEFSFNDEMLTGVPYDHTQGGWAFL